MYDDSRLDADLDDADPAGPRRWCIGLDSGFHEQHPPSDI